MAPPGRDAAFYVAIRFATKAAYIPHQMAKVELRKLWKTAQKGSILRGPRGVGWTVNQDGRYSSRGICYYLRSAERSLLGPQQTDPTIEGEREGTLYSG